jgi:hypothetical protein
VHYRSGRRAEGIRVGKDIESLVIRFSSFFRGLYSSSIFPGRKACPVSDTATYTGRSEHKISRGKAAESEYPRRQEQLKTRITAAATAVHPRKTAATQAVVTGLQQHRAPGRDRRGNTLVVIAILVDGTNTKHWRRYNERSGQICWHR